MWWHQEKWFNKHKSLIVSNHIHSWWHKRTSESSINTACFWTSYFSFFLNCWANIISCISASQFYQFKISCIWTIQLSQFNSYIWHFIWIRKHFNEQSTYRLKSWFTYGLICLSKNNRKYVSWSKATSSWLISIWLEESICKTQRSKVTKQIRLKNSSSSTKSLHQGSDKSRQNLYYVLQWCQHYSKSLTRKQCDNLPWSD